VIAPCHGLSPARAGRRTGGAKTAWLRQAANAARRRLKRIRRGLRSGLASRAEEEAAASVLKDATHALRKEIRVSKARAWQELLDSVDEDPWGRSYKMVMHKIKQWAPPYTESMDPPTTRQDSRVPLPDRRGHRGPLGGTPPDRRGGLEGRVRGHR